MIKTKLSKSDFIQFIKCYIISQIIAIGAYAVPLVTLAPLIGGTIIHKVSEYSETYAKFQDPINMTINYFFCIAFFSSFIVLYLYKNNEIKLQFQKKTINGCILSKEFVTYIKQYGISDLVYYTICSVITITLVGYGAESAILVTIEHKVIRIMLSILIFMFIYSISVLSILKIWDKKRPDYLKKGYIQRIDL